MGVLTISRGEWRKLSGTERDIYQILRKLRVDFKRLSFHYGVRNKLWTVVIDLGDMSLEVPLYQFSLQNRERLEREFRMMFSSIKIVSNGGFLYSVRPVLRYVHLVESFDKAKRIATGWLRRAITRGLEVSLDYEPIPALADRYVSQLDEYLARRERPYLYKIPSINVSMGFWSHDVLIGAVGSIIAVEDEEKKKLLMDILRESSKRFLSI